jgi:hypothetical protein
LLRRAALIGAATGATLLVGAGTAQARVFFGFGVPGVVVAPPVMAAPVVVAPPPVLVAPAPIVAPPPLPPPPMAAVPVGPAPVGYVWVPPAYAWNGAGYVLMPGRYVLPARPGAVWVGGGWFRGPRGWAWRGPHWR